MSDLPREVLKTVLDHLDVPEVVRAGRVDKYFLGVTRSLDCWRARCVEEGVCEREADVTETEKLQLFDSFFQGWNEDEALRKYEEVLMFVKPCFEKIMFLKKEFRLLWMVEDRHQFSCVLGEATGLVQKLFDFLKRLKILEAVDIGPHATQCGKTNQDEFWCERTLNTFLLHECHIVNINDPNPWNFIIYKYFELDIDEHWESEYSLRVPARARVCPIKERISGFADEWRDLAVQLMMLDLDFLREALGEEGRRQVERAILDIRFLFSGILENYRKFIIDRVVDHGGHPQKYTCNIVQQCIIRPLTAMTHYRWDHNLFPIQNPISIPLPGHVPLEMIKMDDDIEKIDREIERLQKRKAEIQHQKFIPAFVSAPDFEEQD